MSHADSLPPGRTEAEEPLVLEVADAIGGLMEFWGFKRVMGRVWTVLYLHDEPLGMGELCERLEISTGAASMALAELERWAVVRRSKRPGERREYFEAETDMWKMISRVLRERELLQIEQALEVFERARAHLAVLPSARLRSMADRIGRLAELGRVGRSLLVALVQQGRADLRPLVRFAAARRR